MKKVLSLVLVIAMVLSSMSFAFAGTFEDVTGDYEDAVNALSALGVINGYEDGTFRPEKTITRAELAKILVEALGYGDLVAGASSNFTDTQGHWANGYVAIAAGTGLVVGYPNGTFLPDKAVTYDEALTMVVRALGYTDASLKGTWPTNYKVKAIDLDLNDDVVMATAAADRGGVAQILFNALEAKIVKIDEDGIVVETTKLLIDNVANLKEYYYVGIDRFNEDDNDYSGNLVDLTPYVYQYIDAYTNDSGDVVYVKGSDSETLTGTVNSVNEASKSFVVKDSEGDKYTINTTGSGVTVYYNGEQTTITASEFNELLYRGDDNSANYDALEAKITVISGDDLATIKAGDSEEIESGDYADHFIVERATKAILVDSDYVSGKAKISGVDGTSLSLPKDTDNEVDLDKVTVTGAVDSLDDIAENDVVVAYEANDGAPVKLVVVRDSVEGEVSKTADGQTTVYVDGTEYTLSRIEGSVRYGTLPSVGDEGTFYLDNAGKIFAVDTDGEALTDYALVLNKANGEYSSKMDGSITDYPQIKLLTAEGETVVYDVLVDLDLTETNDLDDYAIYTDHRAATAATDAPLVAVTPIVGAETTQSITLTATLTPDTLIKYSLNEDGDIDEIEIMNTVSATIDTDDLADIAADDALVFDTANDDVVSIDNLKDGSHTVLYDDGEIVVFVTSNLESANDDIFGVITALSLTKNAKGDIVTEVTAFVDGAEVTYLAENDTTPFTVPSTITTGTAVEFNFGTDDELDNVSAIANDTLANGGDVNAFVGTDVQVTDVTSTYIVMGGTTYRFASDVAVYIYDESAAEWSIGDVSDLNEGEPTAVFNTAATDTIANIVVQTQP
ncbi:MAG: S-layer homology domain-containing protein [Sedimentibacter sp.]|uniref:S-layer homology domain-containing protein n=1 Tax=Sedimentibacter sp. TaxID=1960295 RepID=UPI00298232F4|nr:S-layer homology domain-containing protein [Sedimentibacter sp.]MDW5299409.1 S-layer homology domain-containing protein [Sedimentibacter sp.]